VSQQLPALPAPVGLRRPPAQETLAQGGRGQAGGLRTRGRHPAGGAHFTGAKIFFVDEAHCYAEADLRGKWVRKGEPALVDLTSPCYGEMASYYSAVCLETGEVEHLALEGNSGAETSVVFLRHLRRRHAEPLIVIWDNSPAHGGDPLRASLRTPDLRLRLVWLPAYSPDFNADAHSWGWIREEVTANTCFGTAAKVREHVDPFFAGLATRTDEVKRRCQTGLQTKADALDAVAAATVILRQAHHAAPINADSTLAFLQGDSLAFLECRC
jgi:transposase